MEALKDTFPPDPTGCLDILGVACFLLVELFLWLGDAHTVCLLGYFLVLLLVTVVVPYRLLLCFTPLSDFIEAGGVLWV